MTVIAILAAAQAFFGVLRAFDWFHIGSDLLGQGLLFLPLVGIIAYGRGLLVIAIGSLYLLFAWGLFMDRGWAWSLGMARRHNQHTARFKRTGPRCSASGRAAGAHRAANYCPVFAFPSRP